MCPSLPFCSLSFPADAALKITEQGFREGNGLTKQLYQHQQEHQLEIILNQQNACPSDMRHMCRGRACLLKGSLGTQPSAGAISARAGPHIVKSRGKVSSSSKFGTSLFRLHTLISVACCATRVEQNVGNWFLFFNGINKKDLAQTRNFTICFISQSHSLEALTFILG